MTFTVTAENTKEALLESLAYFADELIERDQTSGLYAPTLIKDEILWTIKSALERMDMTHF